MHILKVHAIEVLSHHLHQRSRAPERIAPSPLRLCGTIQPQSRPGWCEAFVQLSCSHLKAPSPAGAAMATGSLMSFYLADTRSGRTMGAN